MPPGVIDTSWVAIRPKVDESEFRTAINRALGGVEAQATRTTTAVDRQFTRMAGEVNTSMSKVGAESARAFGMVNEHATKSGLVIVEDFKRTASEVDGSFTKMREEADAQLSGIAAKSREESAAVARNSRVATEESRGHWKGLASTIIGAGAVIEGVHLFKDIIQEGREGARTLHLTEAVLRSTGQAAGLTAEDVDSLTKRLGEQSGTADTVVRSGENILLTFTGVRNEVGKNNDIFNQAEAAALDMTAALNHGQISADALQRSNIQLGKALQDPIKGAGALRRVGVDLSAEMQQQIKILVQHGDKLGAQKIILHELSTEFGGAAESVAGAGKKFHAHLSNIEDELGQAFLPALGAGFKALDAFATALDRNRDVVGPLAVGLLGVGAALATVLAVHKAYELAVEGIEIVSKGWARVLPLLDAGLGGQAAAEAPLTAETWGLVAAEDAAAASSSRLTAAAIVSRTGVYGLGIAAYALGGKLLETGRHSDNLFIKLNSLALTGLNPAAFAARGMWRSLEQLIPALHGHAKATGESALETAYATKQQDALHLEMVKAEPQFASQADKLALNAEKASQLKTKLDNLKTSYRQQRDQIAQTIDSYQGLIVKSDVTAKKVIQDVHNQARNYATYARDVRHLIREGIGRDALGWLEQKGPEYVHGLATGTNSQLQVFKKYWKDRTDEVKGNFERSMQNQLDDLRRKIHSMQVTIDRLQGKTVPVGATAHISLEQRTKRALDALGIHGYGTRFLSVGGRLPGYGGGDIEPAMLEPGEAVVPKHLASRGDFVSWARDNRIPGYAAGGLITGFRDPAVRATAIWGDAAANRLGEVAGVRLAGIVADTVRGMTSPFMGGPAGTRISGPVVGVVKGVASRYGWGTGSEWNALAWIINHESGFNPNAQNPTSTAYGLFQFLNGTWGAVGGHKTSDPYLQSVYGLRYIAGRYGDPLGAQAFWRAHGWYGDGGWITEPVFGVGASGRTYSIAERGPEYVSNNVGGTLPSGLLPPPSAPTVPAERAVVIHEGAVQVHVHVDGEVSDRTVAQIRDVVAGAFHEFYRTMVVRPR